MTDQPGKTNGVARLAEVKAAFNGWDGTPHDPPGITIRAWWIDPYWYVSSTDGELLVMSQQDILTQSDLEWCVAEHVRLLRQGNPDKGDKS